MKNIIQKIVSFFLCLAAFSCAGGITPADDAALNEFQGKNWYLEEVRSKTGIVGINRNNKPNLIYTIMFNTERFTGIGAPNRYFGPYTANKDRTLLFKKAGSTRMLPIYEMDGLREHEYLAYIERVNRWEVREGKLKLYSSGKDDSQVILVFSNQIVRSSMNRLYLSAAQTIPLLITAACGTTLR